MSCVTQSCSASSRTGPDMARKTTNRQSPSATKKARALELCLAGTSTRAIAKELGVDVRTVTRWRTNPEFDEELKERQTDLSDAVYHVLVARSLDIINGLADLAMGTDVVLTHELNADGTQKMPPRVPAMARVNAIKSFFELIWRHKNSPVKPSEAGAEPETEADVLALLDDIPADYLRRALEAKTKGRSKKAKAEQEAKDRDL